MKTFLSVLVFVSISTMSFAQMAMNTIADQEMESRKTILTEKAISTLAKQQTQSISRKLTSHLSAQVAYSDLMVENSIEGILLLKLTFTPSGQVASLIVTESPHSILTDMVVKAIDALDLNSLVNAPYYGPDAMIIPISFSLR